MKKTVSAILLAALILGLTSGLSLGASALRTHLDSLQINVPAIYQSADLKGEGNITINSGDRIYIIGWVAFSSSDGLKEIKYGINGVEYACEDNYRDRTDLSANGIVSYNNGAHAGFGKDDGMMELTGIDKLAPGSYTVTLKAYSYGGASSEFKTFRLTVKGGDVMQLDALQVNSAALGASENLKGRGRVTVYSGDRLYVAGWAAFFGGAKLEKIVYECGGKTYECEDNYRDRPDVQSIGIYPADGGAHAGYGSDEAMLELSGIGSLPFGVYSVTVKAVADNGRADEITSFILRVMSKGGSGCDVNANGAVNNKDVVTLFRYVSGGDVTVDGSAADCNGDGSVDNKDVAYLFRYVSGGETSEPASDTYAGSAPYTENGDVIVVDGVSYPNTANMKNGVTVATDDLGRETVMNGGYVSDGTKNVGLFYFLWMGEHGDSGILDITKILQAGGEAAKKASYSGWGPVGAMHFWGEPLYGYYYSKDTWVMRKHIEELTLANVDFLYIDATNGFPYLSNARALMKIMHEFNEQGFAAPKIVFYTHSSCPATVKQIYDSIYSKNYYPDTWLYLDGKPLIIAYQSECRSGLTSAAYNTFSYREPQWPNEAQKTNGWPWMDFNYPQRVFVNNAGKAEAMSVSVAQHSGTVRFSDSAIYGNRTNRGRSYANGAYDSRENAAMYGLNFEEQFTRAIEANVPYVLVTGWNEWVAQRQATNNDTVIFVDTCSAEFSRDLEPMRGGYFDNYYIQLADLIRRYKGSAPALVNDSRKPIDVNGSFDQWNGVTAVYTDPKGDTVDRSATGFGRKTLKDTSGNNDIIESRVVYDTKNIYFYVKCANNISSPVSGASWMQLFLDADQDGNTGFCGFDYLINRSPDGSGRTTLCRIAKADNGYKVISSEQISYKVSDSEMMISVPLSSVGIRDYNDIMISFKWVDSDTNVTTMEQMYSEGDAAPLGRLCYTFRNHR